MFAYVNHISVSDRVCFDFTKHSAHAVLYLEAKMFLELIYVCICLLFTVFNDGVVRDLLKLDGTIPVYYKGMYVKKCVGCS